jgi:MFS family permease
LGSVLLGIGTAMVYPTVIAAISDVARPTWRARSPRSAHSPFSPVPSSPLPGDYFASVRLMLGVHNSSRPWGYVLGALLSGMIAAPVMPRR